MLNPYGVIIDEVLPKTYRFNEAYQKAIQSKKVANQQVEKNISATKAAKEEYIKRLEDAQGNVNQMVAQADGNFTRDKIEVDAYYEQQQKIAQAIEREGENEARAIIKMNEALASSGGRTMVKLKLAEALQDKKIVILPYTSGGFDIKSTNIMI